MRKCLSQMQLCAQLQQSLSDRQNEIFLFSKPCTVILITNKDMLKWAQLCGSCLIYCLFIHLFSKKHYSNFTHSNSTVLPKMQFHNKWDSLRKRLPWNCMLRNNQQTHQHQLGMVASNVVCLASLPNSQLVP